jgi:hypothetical protein
MFGIKNGRIIDNDKLLELAELCEINKKDILELLAQTEKNNIMKSKIYKDLLNSTPEENKKFIDKYSNLVIRINEIIKKKGITKNINDSSSEISKWLNNEFDFTLRSIVALEVELDEDLIKII